VTLGATILFGTYEQGDVLYKDTLKFNRGAFLAIVLRGLFRSTRLSTMPLGLLITPWFLLEYKEFSMNMQLNHQEVSVELGRGSPN